MYEDAAKADCYMFVFAVNIVRGLLVNYQVSHYLQKYLRVSCVNFGFTE